MAASPSARTSLRSEPVCAALPASAPRSRQRFLRSPSQKKTPTLSIVLPRALLALSVAFTCALVAARGQEAHQPTANGPTALALKPATTPAFTTDEATAGARLFQIHCTLCHGARGEGGKGPALAVPALARATDDAALLRIISGGIAGTEMPGSQLPATAIAQLAAFVRSLGRLAPEPLPGDAARGARLYTTRGACASCHAIHGHGSAYGPELTLIGQRRNAAHLHRALVAPAADVPQSGTPYRSDVSLPENFLYVRVVTRDGRALAGVRINEDAFSLQLRDAAGRAHSLFKSDLAELHKERGYSPMPAYGTIFSPAELDDLVAYLASLRGAK